MNIKIKTYLSVIKGQVVFEVLADNSKWAKSTNLYEALEYVGVPDGLASNIVTSVTSPFNNEKLEYNY